MISPQLKELLLQSLEHERVGNRLETGNVPWKDYNRSARSITAAMKRLEPPRSKRIA
jgi:hypothetical protein